VSPAQHLVTFAATAALSVVAALIVHVVGYLLLFYGAVAGASLGKIVMRITHGKRGAPLALTAIGGALVGALLPAAVSYLLWFHQAHTAMPGAVVLSLAVADPFLWLYLLLVIPALWYWIR